MCGNGMFATVESFGGIHDMNADLCTSGPNPSKPS